MDLLCITLRVQAIEWTVQASLNQHEIDRSFSVLFFLGKPPDDPSSWETSSNYVGAVHSFKASLDTQAGRSDNLVQGFVHLNSHILEHSDLTSLEAALVEPYLTQNLHWEVLKVSLTYLTRKALIYVNIE